MLELMTLEAPAVSSGTRLDQYVILELVARTGTTSIYRAVDAKSDRQVAIKIPHPEIEGDLHFYNRFCREREIGEKLDHPAVVKVLGGGSGSKQYIVAEWAEGRLLRRILEDEEKLPAERAVKIAVAICDALDYIHSQGIVHRDLKPENIMVDGRDQIKLLDFGIAAQAGARRLTFGKLSNVMGSPDYISPEQVKGKRGDARSDVYALGVLLYEMLTGNTPFSGKDPLAIMNSRLVNDPAPPREVAPEISAQVETIILRALERDPRHRYSNVQELEWDLQHPDRVSLSARTNVRTGKQQRLLPWMNPILFYGGLAMIPVAILSFLLLVARHH